MLNVNWPSVDDSSVVLAACLYVCGMPCNDEVSCSSTESNAGLTVEFLAIQGRVEQSGNFGHVEMQDQKRARYGADADSQVAWNADILLIATCLSFIRQLRCMYVEDLLA